MTVEELTKQLATLPQDAQVQVTTNCCGCDVPLIEVEDHGKVWVRETDDGKMVEIHKIYIVGA